MGLRHSVSLRLRLAGRSGEHWAVCPYRQKTRSKFNRRGIMTIPDERNQVDTPAGVRDRPCKPGTAPAERVFGCGESSFGGTLARPIALIRPRKIHLGRDR